MIDKKRFKAECAEILFNVLVVESGQAGDDIMGAIHHIAECPMCNNMAREIVGLAKKWPMIAERKK